MKRITQLAAAALVAGCLMAPSTARADADAGLRLGLTDDPDTLFIGVGFDIFLSGSRSMIFMFEPGVEAGFDFDDGVDYFTIRGSGHFKFMFPVNRREGFYLYPLFGPGVYYINFDCPDNFDCDDTELGIDIGGGFQWQRFSFELWGGLDTDDGIYPDLTLSFGVKF